MNQTIFGVCQSIILFFLVGITLATFAIASPVDIAIDQAALAEKYQRLETLALRIAELAEQDSPERAEQLRATIKRGRELDIEDRFATIVELLEAERLGAAGRNQTMLASQLDALLKQLLADPSEARAEAERKKLEELLRKIRQFIQMQHGLRGRLLNGDAENRVPSAQAKLANEVEQVRRDASEGPPPDRAPDQVQGQQKSSPHGAVPSPQSQQGVEGRPADERSQGAVENKRARAARRLAQARQSMQQALEELEKQNQKQAIDKQTDAQRRLQEASQEIAQALEQLRQEELQRMLTRMSTRFRRMLAEQSDIHDLTQSTSSSSKDMSARAIRIAAQGLANRESELAKIAESALRVLREDGTSVAFPEAVAQIRDDMQMVTTRLADAQLGSVTQGLEEDIIEQLQEAITALDRVRSDLEKKKQQSSDQQQGQSGNSSLVDQIEELRMIRSLQARILRRTAFWSKLTEAEEATPSELDHALKELATRQAQLVVATQQLQNAGEK